MARPRPSQSVKPTKTDIQQLSSEVLRLRLQQLNLPITGSRTRLIERLRSATAPQAASQGRPLGRRSAGRVAKPKSTKRGKTRKTQASHGTSQPHDVDVSASDEEPDSTSVAGSSVEEMLCAQTEDIEDQQPGDILFSPAQMSVIQETVSSSVREAMLAFHHQDVSPRSIAEPRTPSPCLSNVATPLGLNCPLDKTIEDKILRGEYIDFSLLLPDNIYRSQSPALQIRYEDSSPGSQGSPLTLVKRKKPVIDSFHKWLDAFTAYMLVIVAAHPRRALELVKYQQIISKAVSKFKGMAWLSYDEQFRRRAAYDLNLPWDKIDLELWTVTFSGLAKPHCSVCSSPYHPVEDCPDQDPSRKPRRQAQVCFDFNKLSGCQRRSCSFPHNCRRCGSSNHALFNCPSSRPTASHSKPPTTSSERSKK